MKARLYNTQTKLSFHITHAKGKVMALNQSRMGNSRPNSRGKGNSMPSSRGKGVHGRGAAISSVIPLWYAVYFSITVECPM